MIQNRSCLKKLWFTSVLLIAIVGISPFLFTGSAFAQDTEPDASLPTNSYRIFVPLAQKLQTSVPYSHALDFTSLVIEDGFTSEEHSVGHVGAACSLVTLRIISGQAAFENDGTFATATTCDSIVLPGITPGPLHDESMVEITNETENWTATLRIATIEIGGITNVQRYWESTAAIYGDSGRYALLNEKANTSTAGIFVSSENFLSEGNIDAAWLCVRVAWGPGKVNWPMSDPKGAGFSVKPENSNNLIWAQAPQQDVDGIYRSQWGSCNALKVPDSCTVTMNANNSYSACCNAVALAAGYSPNWVNTCSGPEASWPNNPLY